MGTDSKIAWTDHTFNPWIGCTKVSEGCKHCYAEALMDKRWNKVRWGPSGVRKRTQTWGNIGKWHRAAKESGKRARVFCASLADVCECRPEVVPWREELCTSIRATRDWLDWLLLTKRPENFDPMFPEDVLAWSWLGTSIENQAAADERVPHLLRCPAAVRFLSVEPMLGRIDFERAGATEWDAVGGATGGGYSELCRTSEVFMRDKGIHWVIIGVESNGSRVGRLGDFKSEADWIGGAAEIVEQCDAAGVPVFVKQIPVGGKVCHDVDQFPGPLQRREMPQGAIR